MSEDELDLQRFEDIVVALGDAVTHHEAELTDAQIVALELSIWLVDEAYADESRRRELIDTFDTLEWHRQMRKALSAMQTRRDGEGSSRPGRVLGSDDEASGEAEELVPESPSEVAGDAYDPPCPYCGVGSGDQCRTSSGRPSYVHSARPFSDEYRATWRPSVSRV